MTKRIRLGLTEELYCAPLFTGLTDQSAFECIFDVIAKNALGMRAHDLDGAFLSPIDYARESSDYSIIPNIAVSSRTATDSIVLHFKEGLHTVKTLAVHPASPSEVVLASIVLSERFDIRPQIVPVVGPLDKMLDSANAALLVGNAALQQTQGHPNRIDLVEEWFDMTGLPYVHGFWCVRGSELETDAVVLIQQACALGIASLPQIASAEAALRLQQFSPDILRKYLEDFSFAFSELEQEALSEFIRYAYYHGVLPDVADLHFYPEENADDSSISDPLLN